MGGDRKTVGEVQQQIEDHVEACAANYKAIDRRLGRMEGVLLAVAGTVILTLLSAVISLGITIFNLELRSARPVAISPPAVAGAPTLTVGS
jgi:hypothetical protein